VESGAVWCGAMLDLELKLGLELEMEMEMELECLLGHKNRLNAAKPDLTWLGDRLPNHRSL